MADQFRKSWALLAKWNWPAIRLRRNRHGDALADKEIDQLANLEQAQLLQAKIDLKIKNNELKDSASLWKHVGANPVILAAVIPAVLTVCITWGTTYRENNKAEIDRKAAAERLTEETNRTILLGIINSSDPAPKLKVFLDAGVLKDESGKIRETQLKLAQQLPQQILSNIIRAAHDQPLEFGSESNSQRDSLSAILRQTDSYVLNYFFSQGISRQLLFGLFIDSIVIRQIDHQNAPNDGDDAENEPTKDKTDNPDDQKNDQATKQAGIEAPTDQQEDDEQDNNQPRYKLVSYRYDPRNPKNSCNNSSRGMLCFDELVAAFALTGLTLERVSAEDRDYTRLCFDLALAEEEQKEEDPDALGMSIARLRGNSPICASPWNPKVAKYEPDRLQFTFAGQQTYIRLRSTYGILKLLGTFLEAQEKGTVTVPNRPDGLIITKSQTASCFVVVSLENETYCVPQDAKTTKQIFGILEDALILNK
jgi:hypothetical protein